MGLGLLGFRSLCREAREAGASLTAAKGGTAQDEEGAPQIPVSTYEGPCHYALSKGSLLKDPVLVLVMPLKSHTLETLKAHLNPQTFSKFVQTLYPEPRPAKFQPLSLTHEALSLSPPKLLLERQLQTTKP